MDIRKFLEEHTVAELRDIADKINLKEASSSIYIQKEKLVDLLLGQSHREILMVFKVGDLRSMARRLNIAEAKGSKYVKKETLIDLLLPKGSKKGTSTKISKRRPRSVSRSREKEVEQPKAYGDYTVKDLIKRDIKSSKDYYDLWRLGVPVDVLENYHTKYWHYVSWDTQEEEEMAKQKIPMPTEFISYDDSILWDVLDSSRDGSNKLPKLLLYNLGENQLEAYDEVPDEIPISSIVLYQD